MPVATIHFVDLWKAIAIILTGAFGILGLLTESKDTETKKITLWGWIALVGIFISCAGGFVAQLEESSENAAKAQEIAKKAEDTRNNLERAIHPLGAMTFTIETEIPCNDKLYRKFCAYIQKSAGRVSAESFLEDNWKTTGWPGPIISFSVGFYKVEDMRASVRTGEAIDPNLTYLFINEKRGRSSTALAGLIWHLSPDPQKNKINLSFTFKAEEPQHNDGKITSLVDFHDVVMSVHSVLWVQKFVPVEFAIGDQSGMRTEGEKFGPEDIGHGVNMYWYHFPR